MGFRREKWDSIQETNVDRLKKIDELWNEQLNLTKKVLGNKWESSNGKSSFRKTIDIDNYEEILNVAGHYRYTKIVKGYDGIILQIDKYLFTFEYFLNQLKKLG